MNQTTAYALESQFGPPSELVNIKDFLRDCIGIDSQAYLSHAQQSATSGTSQSTSSSTDWADELALSQEEKAAIEAECSVDDITESLSHVLSTPALHAHLVKRHNDEINAVMEAANVNKTKKRKRKEESIPTNLIESPEVEQFRKSLDAIQLTCWPFPAGAAAFIRGSKSSDFNSLDVRSTIPDKNGNNIASEEPMKYSDAVITYSVYDRLSWGNFLSRSSQHMLLASQKLVELCDSIICASNEIPNAVIGENNALRYEEGTLSRRGAVICIEGVAYGDGQGEEDYSDKLLKQMEFLRKSKQREITKGPAMQEQTITDLSLRINEPYWFLHQGNCEHFIVIEEIRLLHPQDRDKKYPVMLSTALPSIDMCQACSKVPAVWSIANDMRLGQSPCLLCAPCWRKMGMPESPSNIVVVPLPKYRQSL